MRFPVPVLTVAVLTAGILSSVASAQELPLAPLRGSDQGVWPVFEGWYDEGDGTYIIYFGYNNRNAEEVVEVPLGENNFIEPTEYDGHQPTEFQPRRHWGVFGIRVPADFPPTEKIYWTLVIDGRTYRVPGHLQADYKTDAIGGGAANAFPPRLAIAGADGAGPMGVTAAETRRARVGEEVELTVAARQEGASTSGLAAAFGALGGAGAPAAGADEASASGRGRGRPPADAGPPGGGDADRAAAAAVMARGAIQVAWFKHQGPGEVTFSSPTGRIAGREGEATTVATFSAPGNYVVRVRTNGSDMASSGHAQCCWSNAYFRISVTR
jgi:hypothetical protein